MPRRRNTTKSLEGETGYERANAIASKEYLDSFKLGEMVYDLSEGIYNFFGK